jgi:Na+/H+ antiporter NhaD/arsenite permease-like protein
MPAMNPKGATLAVFALAYALIVVFYEKKLFIVWASVAVLVLLKLVSLKDALAAIDWNIAMLYFGMLLVSEVFLVSKMPDWIATFFASRAKSVGMAMLLICVFTGLLSTVLENVAVVLLVAPIALSIAKRCEADPAPLFVGMAISANLQGAATLIGDPPSMLLAGHAKLVFNDFFIFNGKPGIFFAIQIGALIASAILFLLFRKYDGKMPSLSKERYVSIVPSILVLSLVFTLAASSSIEHNFAYMTGSLCGIFGILSFVWYAVNSKMRGMAGFFSKLDWQTGVFLIGIFILVRSLTLAGLMEDVAGLILNVSGNDPFSVYLMIVWFSVALSAFIDNVPFLMAMLPVVSLITTRLGVPPYPFFVGLLIGASIGGNVTPIGASANIVAMGIVRRTGRAVKFGEFVRIGLPFSVVAVLGSSLFIWFVFM